MTARTLPGVLDRGRFPARRGSPAVMDAHR